LRFKVSNAFTASRSNHFLLACSFCIGDRYIIEESLVHIFWECNYGRNFWLSIGNFLNNLWCSIPFNAKDIIFGQTEHSSAHGTTGAHFVLPHWVVNRPQCKSAVLCMIIIRNSLITCYCLKCPILKWC
jgi:hypothetical protein